MTNKSSRREFLINTGMSALALPAWAHAAEPAKRPNVLFIMADDLGFADLSCYGQPDFKTPALDQLAVQGMQFNQGYANSAICSATRTALATGRYQHRYRVGLEEPLSLALKDGALPKGTPTIASRFKEQGYRTALVGKWHVGLLPANGPLQFGYEYFFGIPSGAADYFSHRVELSEVRPEDGLYLDNQRVDRPGYLTELLADEAIRIIEQDSSKPFFLSLHFNAPHWPWEGPADEAVSRDLKSIYHRDGGSLATYAQMVQSMDSNIGRVLATLQSKGLSDNTIVVFTSDNGGERFSDTWPLTGTKGELLEGGIRVPLLVRWPGRVAAASHSQQVMISMDFAPTLLAAAGAQVTGMSFDGSNLLPQWLGAAPVPRKLFWRFKASEQAALREGDWKYLKLGGKEHLFDVAKDPRERAELKERYPEVFARMRRDYAAWNAQMLPYPAESFSEPVKNFYPDRY